MVVRSGERAGTRPATRLLASVPWVVVLVGVGLMVVMLLFAMFSGGGAERQAAPPPAPPLYLPTLPPAGPPTPEASPTVGTESPSPSSSVSATPTPSAVVSSAAAASPRESRAGTGGSGRVTARYRVVSSQRDSFDAQLLVSNGSGRAQDWRVELLFTGNVKGIQASGPNLSVQSLGNGWYVLGGTGPLVAGESVTVSMRFTRNGTGERPGQCTVNGDACVIG